MSCGDIAVFMAQINIPKNPDDWKSKSMVTVSDPACGAGCLMIAYANELEKVFPDAKRKTVFYAMIEIDYFCFSAVGIASVENHGVNLQIKSVLTELREYIEKIRQMTD